MPIIKLKENDTYNINVKHWLTDTKAELNTITDKKQGDIGELVDGTKYCCNSSGEWVEQS